MYMYIYACVFCFIFIFKSSLNVESSHMCNIHRIVKETHQIMLYTCEILVQMFSNLVPNVHLCDHVFLNKSYVCLIFVFTGMFIYSFKVFWLLTIKINDSLFHNAIAIFISFNNVTLTGVSIFLLIIINHLNVLEKTANMYYIIFLYPIVLLYVLHDIKTTADENCIGICFFLHSFELTASVKFSYHTWSVCLFVSISPKPWTSLENTTENLN